MRTPQQGMPMEGIAAERNLCNRRANILLFARIVTCLAALVPVIVLVTVSASAQAVGPSFTCLPTPRDAQAKLTCSTPFLALSDIQLVQTYYALRQFVGLGGQDSLKSEFLSFITNTRRTCGLPPIEPSRDQSNDVVPTNATICLADSFDAQRIAWARKLSGAAAEEAARRPERNIALQDKLKTLGFIPHDSPTDGVFGTGTRAAILSWQHSTRRPETAFLGDTDAAVLLGGAEASKAPEPPDPLAPMRSQPLATADYWGTPVSIAYKNLEVTVSNETITPRRACTYQDGGIMDMTISSNSPHATCRAVVARLAIDRKIVLSATPGFFDETSDLHAFHLKIAIRHLDMSTALPQVVFYAYSGGSHCCASTEVATAGADGGWHIINLGKMDGDQGFDFLDLDHDGSGVLVNYAEGFDYVFASYAGSFSPRQIHRIIDLTFQDVTKDPRYRSFLLMDLGNMEALARRYGELGKNGYLAGWVAEKALVGQFDDAWRVMLTSYDKKETWGLTACGVDKRVWVKNTVSDGLPLACPDGQEITYQFPTELALHLLKLGYITPEQSAHLGYDPAKIAAERAADMEAATKRYEEEIAHGWFFMTTGGNCEPLRSPTSPAAIIEQDRARGLQDSFNVLQTDRDGRPVVVRVSEPLIGQIPKAVTFYRGFSKCDTEQQQQKKALDGLR